MSKLMIIQNKISPHWENVTIIAVVTFLGWISKIILGPESLAMLYFLIVLSAALWLRWDAAFIALIMSVLAFDYFFLPPRISWGGFNIGSFFTMAGFLAIGLMISALAFKARRRAIEATGRENQAGMLYRLSNDLAAAESLNDVLNGIQTNLRQIFNCHVGIFLWSDGKIELSVLDPGFPVSRDVYEEKWFLEANNSDGARNELFQSAHVHYAPLQTPKGVFGVLGIFLKNKGDYRPEDNHLLIALANQAAVAIQRTKLAEISRQVELMHEREKLQTALLNSISHDLRTPLVSIMGVLSSLLQDYSSLDSKTREELLATEIGRAHV